MLYGVRRFMADIDSMIGGPTKWYGKAARWYFKICLWFIAPVLLLGIFILAMVGGFDMSYKAWNESGARYTVPNPEYDDWIQGIIWALQVSAICKDGVQTFIRLCPVFQSSPCQFGCGFRTGDTGQRAKDWFLMAGRWAIRPCGIRSTRC